MKSKQNLYYLFQILMILSILICGLTHFVTYMRIGVFASDGGIVHSPGAVLGGNFWANVDGVLLVGYLALLVLALYIHKRGRIYRSIYLLAHIATCVFSTLLLRQIIVFSLNYSVSVMTVFGGAFLTGINYLKILLHLTMCVMATIILLKKGWDKDALKEA